MTGQRCIALIAHDQKKDDMADFARRHQAALSQF
ncbi:MAG: methylglyoxal synthase, partial [Agrobacterium vaccinii]